MSHGKTYDVNGYGFDSFLQAIAFARPIRAHVIEVASGIRRWQPASERASERAQKRRHILVSDDGSLHEFSRVRR